MASPEPGRPIGILKEHQRVELTVRLSELQNGGTPTDEGHVQLLANSIHSGGQHTPLLVWSGKGEILDGFHRLEALTQLRVPQTRIHLIDCSQEDAMDIRITSAVTHKGVSFARVVTWTREVFASTPWAEKLGVTDAFAVASDLGRFPQHLPRVSRRTSLSPEEIAELDAWVKGKSDMWGLTPTQVRNMLQLADKTPASVIPLVRERTPNNPHVLTRAMLGSIVETVKDPTAQEALVKKALSERLAEPEVQQLVREYMGTAADQRSQLLTTDWNDILQKRRDRHRAEVNSPSPAESQRSSERFLIDTTTALIRDLNSRIPQLALNNHPDLTETFQAEVTRLIEAVAALTGSSPEAVSLLGERIEVLKKQIDKLTLENLNLRARVQALQRTRDIERNVDREDYRRDN